MKFTCFYSQDEDDDEEDPDARADPMYGLNLKQYLTEFLHDFCKQGWIDSSVKFVQFKVGF